MRLAAIACLVACALPLGADTVITTDGRTLTGEVFEEGDKIVIKMKIGTIKLDKAQVKEIKKDDGSGPAAATGGSASYKSYLLGYVLKVPTTKYVLQRIPPEPLVDVILYDSGTETEISLGVVADEDMPDTLNGESARALGAGAKGGLDMYFQKLDVLSAEAAHIGAFDTARIVLEGQRRDNKRKQHIVWIYFRLRDQWMVLCGEALLGKHKALDADAAKIVETLESFEPKEDDGTTIVDMKGCYSVAKLGGWEARAPKEQEHGASRLLLHGESKCFVGVQWELDSTKRGVRDVGQGKVEEMKKQGDRIEVLSGKMLNLKGKVAWEIVSREKADDGTKLWGRYLVFRTSDRVYTILQCGPETQGDKKILEVTTPVFDGFEIYPDLLSKGSLENGRKAVTAVREADEKRIGGNPKGSLGLYEQAIELYPPYAGAYNNRGNAYMDADQFDEAYKDMTTASELAPNDFLVSRNMAICRLTKAYKSLEEGRITSALDEADRMRGRAKDDEELSNTLGIFYFNVGMHYYNQKKLGTAKAFFKKGMDFYHDKDAVKNALSIISYNEAIEALNSENWHKAKSLLEESLKYDPSNGQAKQLLEQVKQELSK